MKKEFCNRKTTRLKSYDYGKTGMYFVTICVEGRKRILSEIIKVDDIEISGETVQNLVGELLAAPDNERFELSENFEGQTIYANNYKTRLTPIGEIAKQQMFDLEKRYNNVKINRNVIMPDHIHILINLRMEQGAASGSPTLHAVIRSFKSLTSRECKKMFGIEKIFQRSFVDHIIRNREDYEKHVKYICENPLRRYHEEKQQGKRI